MFFSNGCPEQVFVYLVLTARNKVKVSLGGPGIGAEKLFGTGTDRCAGGMM